MAKTSGAQVAIGIGIESAAAPGTAVAEAHFIPFTAFSLQGVAEKAFLTSARGLRLQNSNSMIRRKYAQGSIAFVPNVEIAPFFFSLALGSCTTATASGESAVYDHTFSVQNANATVRTATITTKTGGVQTPQYVNCVCNTLGLEVSDGYASMTADLIGKFPSTDTVSESYAQETEFAYHQMTAKFGTSFSNAAGNTATPLKAFSLSIENNILLDDAFLSGSNEIAAGGLVRGPLKISGSYSLHFENTTELAKYQANTKNALIVTFTGADIGTAGSGVEQIQIKLGKIVLTNPPLEYTIDGLIVLNQQFEVEYDATDGDITVIVTNDQANASGARYQPA
jgi:hypothetical protein